MFKKSLSALAAASVLSMPVVAFAEEATVPEGDGVAIGAGVSFPGDILTFNTVTAKVRMGGLQIEPFVLVGVGSSEDVTEQEGTSTTQTDTGSALGILLGANVRFPLASSDVAELQALGSLSIANGSSKGTSKNENTAGATEDTFESGGTTIGLGYGIGIEWWVTKQVSIAASATTPLVEISSGSSLNDPEGTDNNTESTSSDNTFQLAFNPTVAATVNIWF